jgi:hypothetical protein
MNISSYTFRGYTLVVLPTRVIVHHGDTTSPIVHTAVSLSQAILWINKAK